MSVSCCHTQMIICQINDNSSIVQTCLICLVYVFQATSILYCVCVWVRACVCGYVWVRACVWVQCGCACVCGQSSTHTFSYQQHNLTYQFAHYMTFVEHIDYTK